MRTLLIISLLATTISLVKAQNKWGVDLEIGISQLHESSGIKYVHQYGVGTTTVNNRPSISVGISNNKPLGDKCFLESGFMIGLLQTKNDYTQLVMYEDELNNYTGAGIYSISVNRVNISSPISFGLNQGMFQFKAGVKPMIFLYQNWSYKGYYYYNSVYPDNYSGVSESEDNNSTYIFDRGGFGINPQDYLDIGIITGVSYSLSNELMINLTHSYGLNNGFSIDPRTKSNIRQTTLSVRYSIK